MPCQITKEVIYDIVVFYQSTENPGRRGDVFLGRTSAGHVHGTQKVALDGVVHDTTPTPLDDASDHVFALVHVHKLTS